MKSRFFLFVLTAVMMAACGHKQTNTASDAQATDSIVTDSLVVEQEITYYSAIDRYLVDEFGKNYTEGEY